MPNFYLDICAGQSNNVGVLPPDAGDVDIAGVYQWVNYSGDANYRTWSSDVTPFLWVTENSVKLSPHLARAGQVLTDEPTARVGVVPTAQSTTSIVASTHLWASSSTPGAGSSLFEGMIDAATRAYNDAILTGHVADGYTVIPRLFWEQGESDTTGVGYSTYLTAFEKLIDDTRSRLNAAGLPNTSGTTMPVIIGSMLPSRWLRSSTAWNQGYEDINRAHVQATLDKANVKYAMGPNVTSPDNIHYQPTSAVRSMGVAMESVLTDVTGPTMQGATSMCVSPGNKLALAVFTNDTHSTIEIHGGTNAAMFELSDPYLLPTLRFVGDGTASTLGTYTVNLRGRDGSGNFGADQTYTITVAAEVSPTTLFTSSELGMVWDLSNFANLYQTIDGTTTAVTAVGQVVGWVKDLSPNANHWKAAANDTTRPTLQQDSDGKYYLNFDGVNDALHAAVPFIAAHDGRHTAIVGTLGAAPAAQKSIFGAYCNTGTSIFMEPLDTATSGGGIGTQYRNDASGTIVGPNDAGMLDGATKRIITSAYAGSSLTSRIRDAQARPSDGSASAGYVSTTTGVLAQNFTLLTRSTMGARGFSSISGWFAGRIYSGFVINRYLTDNEVKMTEEWVAARALSTTLPGTASPTTNITGSTSLLFSPAGTITGLGAITGSTALTFSANLLAPTGTNITGTSSLTFTPTATLTGTGQITGTAALTFTLSGGITLPVGPPSPTAIFTTTRFVRVAGLQRN